MYWLFNRKWFPISGSPDETVSWSQKRNFKGAVDDIIIFFLESNDGFHFTHSYKIISVEQSEVKGEAKERVEQNIKLGLQLLNQYGNEKPFYQYVYSFPRIRSFTRYLYRHFKNKYYRLSAPEFDAIDKDKIYISRTVVGIALNSMHIDHRMAFIEFLIKEYPKILIGDFEYYMVFSYLREYMLFSIIEPSHQLVDALHNAKEFLDESIVDLLGFSDGQSKLADPIAAQTLLIQNHITSYNAAVNELIDLKAHEGVFKKLFLRTGLPIEL